MENGDFNLGSLRRLSRRAAFVDRDGIINEYVYFPEHGIVGSSLGSSPVHPDYNLCSLRVCLEMGRLVYFNGSDLALFRLRVRGFGGRLG